MLNRNRLSYALREHPGVVPAIVALLFIANLGNALNKGGDFDAFLVAGQRLLSAAPLYTGSGAGTGVTWPPFLALVVAPFSVVANLNVTAAKVLWHAVGCIALLFALRWWPAALSPGADPDDPRHGRVLGSPLLPLIAVLFPLQTNFEHQNINPLLLAITGAAAVSIRQRRDLTSGVLVGIAAALKAFPGLLIAFLLMAKRWRAAAAALVAAVVCTMLTAIVYGPSRSVSLVRDWLAVNEHGGWPIRGNNQSLFAMLGRYFGSDGLSATGHLSAAADPMPYYLTAITTAVLVLALGAIVVRSRRDAIAAPTEMAATLALSVLISPIAWDHYWVLMFPAFYVVFHRAQPWDRRIFWLSAVLVSGLTPAIIGPTGLAVARMLSAWTVAGLLLFGRTLFLCCEADDAPGPNRARPARQ